MISLIYHSIYSALPLPKEHRYPIHKYHLLYKEVARHLSENPTWRDKFIFVQPQSLSIEEVMNVHCPEYIDSLFSGVLPAAKMRRIGFPWSEELVKRTLISAGGTCLAVEKAIEQGVSIHLSGGYHHAHYDFGSGFCLVNDLVLAAKRGLKSDDVETVLIVDSDVHHGDGTATLCRNESDIITLSFHCDKNFPARKPESDLDVALPRETADEEFLSTFKSVVQMAIQHHQPDLIIYDAGVDIHINDELGFFNISTQGIYLRDHWMLSTAKQSGISIACVVGGGYRTEHKDLVPIHMQLLKAAEAVFD